MVNIAQHGSVEDDMCLSVDNYSTDYLATEE